MELILSSKKESKQFSKPQPSKLSAERDDSHISSDDLQGVHAIQVLNVPKISEHYLKLALEKHADGKVCDIKMYPETSTAIVRFKQQQGEIQLIIG